MLVSTAILPFFNEKKKRGLLLFGKGEMGDCYTERGLEGGAEGRRICSVKGQLEALVLLCCCHQQKAVRRCARPRSTASAAYPCLVELSSPDRLWKNFGSLFVCLLSSELPTPLFVPPVAAAQGRHIAGG